MTQAQKIAQEAFESFLNELCNHVKIAGGEGDRNDYRRMPLEQIFTELYPNGIVLGFKNHMMIDRYSLSKNLRNGYKYDAP